MFVPKMRVLEAFSKCLWTCFDNVQGIFGECFGNFVRIFLRTCFGSVLEMFWKCGGNMFEIFWICFVNVWQMLFNFLKCFSLFLNCF